MVPPLDPPLVECLEVFHRVVVGVFVWIVDPETKDNVNTFEETFVGAMRTRNPRMTRNVIMFINHVPEYVHRTGIQLGSTYEQALKSRHTFFDIFYHRFKVTTRYRQHGNVASSIVDI